MGKKNVTCSIFSCPLGTGGVVLASDPVRERMYIYAVYTLHTQQYRYVRAWSYFHTHTHTHIHVCSSTVYNTVHCPPPRLPNGILASRNTGRGLQHLTLPCFASVVTPHLAANDCISGPHIGHVRTLVEYELVLGACVHPRLPFAFLSGRAEGWRC